MKASSRHTKKFLSKLTILALVFLFLFQPIAPVFATTYTYDYNNRLTSATNTDTGAITTYAYDWQGQRIKMTIVDPSKGINTTTYYLSKYYEKTYDNNNPSAPPKIVKHIFGGDGKEVATIFDTGKDAKTYYTLTDHLGNITGYTDSTGKLVETTDYYPFGAIRIDKKTDPVVSSPNKFLGQKYDEQTGLNYLNARYYNSAIGKFTTQDPVYLAIGDAELVQQLTGRSQQELLSDPQKLNPYSYARNNPITLSDPNGKSSELDVVRIPGIPGAHTFIHTIADQPGEDLSQYGPGPNYTIGGYMSEWWGGNLVAKINESGNLNASRESYLASFPLAPPEGMSVAQYDQKLLEAGVNLAKKDLGMYLFWGQPISNFANSGNVSAQVIIDARGTVSEMPNVYFGNNSFLGLRPIYFPLGAGKPIGTPSLGQQFDTATRNYINNKTQSVLNSIYSTFSLLSKELNKANGN